MYYNDIFIYLWFLKFSYSDFSIVVPERYRLTIYCLLFITNVGVKIVLIQKRLG